jgi:hypothetical protein
MISMGLYNQSYYGDISNFNLRVQANPKREKSLYIGTSDGGGVSM